MYILEEAQGWNIRESDDPQSVLVEVGKAGKARAARQSSGEDV